MYESKFRMMRKRETQTKENKFEKNNIHRAKKKGE